mgnify:FL=1|tara:strand:- start:1416 stop:1988 length:573 start_codon:yes stop_codon:yes gene_type:complete
MTDLKQAIDHERKRYCVAAGGGVSLPVAGALYWAVMGGLGFYLAPSQWAIAAAAGSGLIFPLGILLQAPMRSPFMKSKSPLSGVTMAAIAAINLLWPIHILLIGGFPEAAPLTLAIGMSLHWPIIGWAYHSRVSLIHAFVRVAAVTVIWYGFPDWRLTGIPFVVAGLYLFAAAGLRREVLRFRRAGVSAA